MPVNKSRLFLVATLTCILLVAIGYGLTNRLGSSNFGKLAISTSAGSTVYVVRESWGLHSDEISLTLNPDGCVPSDPATDYIDTYGDGQSLVYSSTRDGLTLYADSGPVSIHEPTHDWAGVKISVQKTPALGNMLHDPNAYGVTVIKVPLNEMCWKNFFRKARTSLRNGR